MAGYPWGLCEAILAATHKGEARSVRRRSRRSRSHTPSGTNCISSPAASPTRPMAAGATSTTPYPRPRGSTSTDGPCSTPSTWCVMATRTWHSATCSGGSRRTACRCCCSWGRSHVLEHFSIKMVPGIWFTGWLQMVGSQGFCFISKILELHFFLRI